MYLSWLITNNFRWGSNNRNICIYIFYFYWFNNDCRFFYDFLFFLNRNYIIFSFILIFIVPGAVLGGGIIYWILRRCR